MDEDIVFEPFFGTPTAEQLMKIRALQPAGSRRLAANEVIVASLVIADNFMRRDGMHSLAPQTLVAMSRTLPGSTFTRDHDTNMSSKKMARFFDSRITLRQDVTDEEMASDGFGRENREIYEAQGGYYRLWADVFVDAKSSMVNRLRKAVDAEVSYHGMFLDSRLVCSGCNCSHPDGISGRDCWMLDSRFPWEWFLSEEEMARVVISSYETIEAEGFDPYETSFVVVPAYSRSGTSKN